MGTGVTKKKNRKLGNREIENRMLSLQRAFAVLAALL